MTVKAVAANVNQPSSAKVDNKVAPCGLKAHPSRNAEVRRRLVKPYGNRGLLKNMSNEAKEIIYDSMFNED